MHSQLFFIQITQYFIVSSSFNRLVLWLATRPKLKFELLNGIFLPLQVIIEIKNLGHPILSNVLFFGLLFPNLIGFLIFPEIIQVSLPQLSTLLEKLIDFDLRLLRIGATQKHDQLILFFAQTSNTIGSIFWYTLFMVVVPTEEAQGFICLIESLTTTMTNCRHCK